MLKNFALNEGGWKWENIIFVKIDEKEVIKKMEEKGKNNIK